MTNHEAGAVRVDDQVLIKVEGEGWVPGTVVDVLEPGHHWIMPRPHGYIFGIIATDGREFPNVRARYVKRAPRKQDWSPRQRS